MDTIFRRIIPRIAISRHKTNHSVAGITTKLYEPHRFIGNPPNQARIFESNMADELIIVNLDLDSISTETFAELVSDVSSEIFMPLSVGGGIDTLEKASMFFEIGIEKIVVERGLINNGEEVNRIANRYGSQSVVASCTYWGSATTSIPESLARRGIIPIKDLPRRIMEMQEFGIGEIMINDASRDGTRMGSNLDALNMTLENTSLPVIDSCGFGKTKHIVESFEAGSSAVAIGTYFAFVDQSFMQLRNQLANHGIRVRLK